MYRFWMYLLGCVSVCVCWIWWLRRLCGLCKHHKWKFPILSFVRLQNTAPPWISLLCPTILVDVPAILSVLKCSTLFRSSVYRQRQFAFAGRYHRFTHMVLCDESNSDLHANNHKAQTFNEYARSINGLNLVFISILLDGLCGARRSWALLLAAHY